MPLLLAAARHLLHLAAKLLHGRQRLLHGLVVLLAFAAGADGLLHLVQVIAQVVQAGGNLRLRHHGVFAHAAANPVGIALHVARQFLLLHLAERIAHLGGRLALRGRQIAHRVLHLLLQFLHFGDLILPLIGQLAGLLRVEAFVFAERLAQLAFELLLLAGEILGLADQVVHLAGGLLAAHALHHLLGLLQAFERALRCGLPLWGAGLLR